MNMRSQLIGLVLVLVLAAGLRAPGLFWGDGDLVAGQFVHWHPDETTHVNIVRHFLDQHPRCRGDYIMGFGAQMAVVALAARAMGVAVATSDIYRIGRWVSLAYGLGMVALLYVMLAHIFRRPGLGLAAAGLLALSSLAVTQSHFAVADMAGTFWIWLAAYLCYRAHESKSLTLVIAAWAAAAMAVAIKLAVVAGLPVLIISLVRTDRRRVFILGPLTALVVFVAANGLGLRWENLVLIWNNLIGDNFEIIPDHGSIETPVTLLLSLAPAFSLPLIVFAGIGLWRLPRPRLDAWPLWVCLGLPGLSHFILLLFLDDAFERHLLPLTPLLCGLAAWAWIGILPQGGRLLVRTVWSLPLILYLAFFAVDGERPFWHDNRIDGRQWVLNQIQAGSRVLALPYTQLRLPKRMFRVRTPKAKRQAEPVLEHVDLILVHEFYTYRYDRSRFSPLGVPAPGRIYHPDAFGLKYLTALRQGQLRFEVAKVFPCGPPWAWERIWYRKFWGTFQSFVGDLTIYRRKDVQ